MSGRPRRDVHGGPHRRGVRFVAVLVALALVAAACVDDGGPDPCATANGGCDPLTTCSAIAGQVVCSPCPTGYAGTGELGCADADECLTGAHACDPLTTCINQVPGHRCTSCPAGYITTLGRCVDIDECADGTSLCDAATLCVNTEGGYRCGDCPPGYVGGWHAGCADLDECGAIPGACDPATECVNTPGSYRCGDCPPGFGGDGRTACVDLDECSLGTAACDPLVGCINEPGGYACGPCPAGYSGTGDTACLDDNECGLGFCDPLVTCSNLAGSFVCGPCPAGYEGAGETACVDVDECAAGLCDPVAHLVSCTNTPGGFTCGACPAGYQGDPLYGCFDVPECSMGGCSDLVACTDTAGSFTCGDCPSGFEGSGRSGCFCSAAMLSADGDAGSVSWTMDYMDIALGDLGRDLDASVDVGVPTTAGCGQLDRSLLGADNAFVVLSSDPAGFFDFSGSLQRALTPPGPARITLDLDHWAGGANEDCLGATWTFDSGGGSVDAVSGRGSSRFGALRLAFDAPLRMAMDLRVLFASTGCQLPLWIRSPQIHSLFDGASLVLTGFVFYEGIGAEWTSQNPTGIRQAIRECAATAGFPAGHENYLATLVSSALDLHMLPDGTLAPCATLADRNAMSVAITLGGG